MFLGTFLLLIDIFLCEASTFTFSVRNIMSYDLLEVIQSAICAATTPFNGVNNSDSVKVEATTPLHR
jgi:hypothetical protein